jgi:hypothetical protein
VTADAGDEMVPLQRVELVTRDMDLTAELIRGLHIEHVASFSCLDAARVNGRVRSVTAGGLHAPLSATTASRTRPIVQKLTWQAAVAFLAAFPSITMTTRYLPGPEG